MRRRIYGLYFAMGFAAILLALALSARSASAHVFPCDFLTGGGFIMTTASGTHVEAKANFGVGGGCKHGSPTWGHLEYQDHGQIIDGNHLNVHWTSITAYLREDGETPDPEPDPKTRQPRGTRLICGTARTNHYGDVDFMVRVTDNGEPGVDDEFDIRLSQGVLIVYTTENEPDFPNTLGGDGPGGGNIQLHKPNPSTTGDFGGECAARAATF
jgi:hypothetical protein